MIERVKTAISEFERANEIFNKAQKSFEKNNFQDAKNNAVKAEKIFTNLFPFNLVSSYLRGSMKTIKVSFLDQTGRCSGQRLRPCGVIGEKIPLWTIPTYTRPRFPWLQVPFRCR